MSPKIHFTLWNASQLALTGMAVMGLTLLAQLSTTPVTGSPSAPPSTELRALFEQFQGLTSVSISANVEITITEQFAEELDENDAPFPPAVINTPISAQFEFRACGDRYRVDSYADSEQYPGLPFSVAYDGQNLQTMLAPDLLVTRPGDTNVLLPSLPHPLLQLVQFRYPITDETYAWDVRLKDVSVDAPPQGFWSVEWADTEEGGASLERAVFPGGDYEGHSYVHQVLTPRGERNRPYRIDRVTPDGRRLTSTTFSDYRPADEGQPMSSWPRRVVMEAYGSEGRLAARFSYEITHLAIDVPMSSDVFVLPSE